MEVITQVECIETSFKCCDCNGTHSVADKSCPHYLQEVKFKSLHHLGEAMRSFSDTEKEEIKSCAGKISSAPTVLYQAQNLVTEDVWKLQC